MPDEGDVQWRRADGTTGTYHGPLRSLGVGIPRPMRDHGFRRAVFDLAYGYTSGFPVRDIIPFAACSLFRQRIATAYAQTAAGPEHQMNPATSEYLESFGIDTNRMPLNGWDRTGYTLFDGPGPLGDSTRPVRHEWPAGFDYGQMLARWAVDAPSRGPHGVIEIPIHMPGSE